MENSVKQRLMQYLAFKDIPNAKFEKVCGLCNGYVAGIRRSIGPDKLKSITANYPDLNRDWLLYGEGEMLNPGYTTFNPVGIASQPDVIPAEQRDELIEALREQVKTLTDVIAEKDRQIDRLFKLLEK